MHATVHTGNRRQRGKRLPAPVVRKAMQGFGSVILHSALPVAAQRRMVDLTIGAALRPPSGTTWERDWLGGVACERVTPPRVSHSGTLLYLHGGGYAIGSPRSHRSVVARLAVALGTRAVVPDYRMGPEHTHPAAINDVVSVYEALQSSEPSNRTISVAGESAGGGLTLALGMAARDAGRPPPAALGMVCPWLDLRTDARTGYPVPPGEPVVSEAKLERWAAAYAGREDRSDPRLSPLLGDLGGLPPIILHSAESDPLVADSERLHERALAADANVEYQRNPGLWHAFHILAGIMAESDVALEQFAASLKAFLPPET